MYQMDAPLLVFSGSERCPAAGTHRICLNLREHPTSAVGGLFVVVTHWIHQLGRPSFPPQVSLLARLSELCLQLLRLPSKAPLCGGG